MSNPYLNSSYHHGSPAARPIGHQAPAMLSLAEIAKREKTLAHESWVSFQRTLSHMRAYGTKCMAVWFPHGEPVEPPLP